MADEQDGEQDLDFVSYAEFGEQFFPRVVTQERVVAAVDGLAGQPLSFGPMGVGPGRVVKVTVDGSIGAASGAPLFDPDHVAYRVVLPIDLRLDVDLGVETHTFEGSLEVPLVLTARAVDGLRVFIEVTPPRSREVGVKLKAHGLRATMLQRVAGVEGEVRRFVAKYVAKEVDKPAIMKSRLFDVGDQVDRALASLMSSGESSTAETISGDFVDAMEDEILLTAAGMEQGRGFGDADDEDAPRGGSA